MDHLHHIYFCTFPDVQRRVGKDEIYYHLITKGHDILQGPAFHQIFAFPGNRNGF